MTSWAKRSDDSKNQTGLTSDSTAVIGFSFVMNHQYFKEIINEVKRKFNFEKLLQLKEKNFKKYLEEARNQVGKVCSGMEALQTHSNFSIVNSIYRTIRKEKKHR